MQASVYGALVLLAALAFYGFTVKPVLIETDPDYAEIEITGGLLTHRLGGSFAQRDIIAWTLLEAALRAKQYHLALALANERSAFKPTSPQNWSYVAQAFKGLGDQSNADRAEAKAQSLIAGCPDFAGISFF